MTDFRFLGIVRAWSGFSFGAEIERFGDILGRLDREQESVHLCIVGAMCLDLCLWEGLGGGVCQVVNSHDFRI